VGLVEPLSTSNTAQYRFTTLLADAQELFDHPVVLYYYYYYYYYYTYILCGYLTRTFRPHCTTTTTTTTTPTNNKGTSRKHV